MVSEATSKTTLPQELIDFVDVWREKPGNLIMILHKMQSIFGYIPRAEALELARYMDVPLARIYGVITFYHFFKLKKPGRNKIQVCMGTACYLKGGQDLIDEIENLIDIGVSQTTEGRRVLDGVGPVHRVLWTRAGCDGERRGLR